MAKNLTVASLANPAPKVWRYVLELEEERDRLLAELDALRGELGRMKELRTDGEKSESAHVQ